MLGRDYEDEIWSRFVQELVIWPKEVTQVTRTQSSDPLCLWQCFYQLICWIIHYWYFSATACFSPHILHTCYINLYLERSRITFPAFRGAGSQRGTHYIQIHWLINYTVEDCNDIFWWPLDFLHTYCAPDISRDPASHSHASRRGGRRACCREANFSKSLAWVFFWCLFMIRIGLKNFKTLSLILHDWK